MRSRQDVEFESPLIQECGHGGVYYIAFPWGSSVVVGVSKALWFMLV